MTTDVLKTLLLANRPALMRFLILRGASREEADDLLQDTFLLLSRKAIAAVDDPRAYLYRIVDNLLLDQRRASLRRARRETLWLESSFENGASSPAPATDNALIAHEELRLVTAALATMPDRTVEIFRRFRIEGERQKAIASDLAISVSAVEKHLQRAYEVVLAVKMRSDAGNIESRRLDREGDPDAK